MFFPMPPDPPKPEPVTKMLACVAKKDGFPWCGRSIATNEFLFATSPSKYLESYDQDRKPWMPIRLTVCKECLAAIKKKESENS